jgi:hypothetical protein
MIKTVTFKWTNLLNSGYFLLNNNAEPMMIKMRWKYLSKMMRMFVVGNLNPHITCSHKKITQTVHTS